MVIANAEAIPRFFITIIWRNTRVQRVRGWSKNKSCYRSMHDQEFIKMAQRATGANRGINCSPISIKYCRVWDLYNATVTSTTN